MKIHCNKVIRSYFRYLLRLTCLFILLLECRTPSLAQRFNELPHSIVYLENGSVYIGEILDAEGWELRMRLAVGDEIIFSKAAVKNYLPADRLLVFNNGKYHFSKGVFLNTSFGFNIGNVSDENGSAVSSHTTFLVGYNVNHRYALGIGYGFEFNQAEISGFFLDTQFNPLYLYGRYYLTHTKARLFGYGRMGFGFSTSNSGFNNDHSGGFQFQAGGGVLFASRKKSKFALSMGYHAQKTNGRESFLDNFGNEVVTEYDIWIRRLIFKFAVEFNWGKGRF